MLYYFLNLQSVLLIFHKSYLKKVNNATEMQKRIYVVCGEGAMTDQTCQIGF